MAVPHTDVVKICFKCNGTGQVRKTRASDGEIETYYETCSICRGARNLKHFVDLKVKYITHKDTYVYETTDLPDKLILKGTGENMFNEEASRIGPIVNFYIDDININSALLESVL